MIARTALASLAHPILLAAEHAHIALDDLALPPVLRRAEPPPPGERIPHETLLEIWRVAGERPPALVLRGPVAAGMSVAPTGHLFVADRGGPEIFALGPDGV
ncbi:MAG TPA: hypothetical protein VFS00_26595, partial [Polyangiaceae bacterium]|nr:hypothetical protein [Polyangiaceae bacterium]